MPRAEVAGVDVHYEEDGSGDPVVLLHGGLQDGTGWEQLVPHLADRHRVLVPDRRGHGRTPDVEGPYTYQAMAEETAALIEALGAAPAHLVGFSDGAIVALLLASRRPELVRSAVAISGNLDAEGLHPAMRARLEAPDPDAPGLAPLRDDYAATSPDGPDHWATFHRKVSAMGAAGPGMTLDDVRRIEAPVLVVSGDDDVVLLEHTVALYEALPDGQLAVVPGTSHLLVHERPDAVRDLVVAFLADPSARRIMPMRRAPVG